MAPELVRELLSLIEMRERERERERERLGGRRDRHWQAN